MKPVYVCVPVLRRYDLLRELVISLGQSTLRPATFYVIDNGRNPQRLAMALAPSTVKTELFIPDEPMGVAESWNWFIENVDEERVIVNDDVVFASDSLERIIAAGGDLVTGLPNFVTATPGNAFSCFLIRDSCIEKVGLFDEEISPGYAYFEDCDYEQRMYDLGIMITHVDCGVRHEHSASLKAASGPQMEEHHRRFLLAQSNYKRKWGGMPRGVVEA